MIGILIVNFNNMEHLLPLFTSILNQSHKRYHIYFLDNKSTDGSKEFAVNTMDSLCLPYTSISSEINLGFAGGNNLAAKYALKAGCDSVLCLNPDMILQMYFIDVLETILFSNEKIGAAGPLILFPDGHIQEFGGDINFSSYQVIKHYSGQDSGKTFENLQPIKEVDFLSGGAILIKSTVIEQVGLWEERYFMYGDEIDFSFRLKKSGYKMLVTSSAITTHTHNWKNENKSGLCLEYYYMIRNKYFFYHFHHKYLTMFIAIIYDLLTLPLKMRWFMRKSNSRAFKYYCLGMIHGLFVRYSDYGKAIISFK